ncbi:MAG: acetyl-CoA carboxylase biotin carboxylase subunit [Gammaproteobacteria bacterium]|nr:MAG: acetyl-CoA carboxylase biotin carboxylase subunit [Gammaproteobacteria bacterium]
MFSRILVANRGEIACRVIRTCRRLGIHVIAVYSDADAQARHVREADDAIRIGPAEPTDSYLNIDRVIEAAIASKAGAIHPGYGFLSENPQFASAVRDAGLVFIGPEAETIRTMGSKRQARTMMIEAGVPVVPGFEGEIQDEGTLLAEATRIGFPVILKPSAGGGGKGMRVMRDADGWSAVVASARREAQAAFGNDHMIIERFVERARHVEVQIFADNHGNVLHLFERECSIQRRQQKIIEEAPCPALDEGLRAAITEAAVTAAVAVDYRNAGTVEFLLDESGHFYFMEMNTRLQVEHPVTEAITGVDLVEWQLRAAAGEPVPVTQSEITRHGHAIEARIYAENPFNDFLPSTGRIGRFVHPVGALDLRIDSGVDSGDRVDVYYDPMLAKLVVWGENREIAIRRLRRALARTMLTGPMTNLALLRSIAGHADFVAGKMDTAYLERNFDALLSEASSADQIALIAAACALQLGSAEAAAEAADPYSPWDRADGWRHGGGGVRMRFEDPCGQSSEVTLSGWDGRFAVTIDDVPTPVTASKLDPDHLELSVGEEQYQATVLTDGDSCYVGLDFGGFELRRVPNYDPSSQHGEEDTHPVAPMPGRIVVVYVTEGESVTAGQSLLALEGMKMEYTLKAPVAGRISRIFFSAGDMVEADTALVDIEPETDAAT